ncbi:MAG: ribonuclease HII [Fimbriimonadaceae bacterium]|nr:ribonuclease HII [Fimbriimonadaceae bacterium]
MSALRHLPGVAGIDEAGRGPLAGPVVVAAVVLPEEFDAEGLDDSKQLDRATRELLAERIRRDAHWSIAYATIEEIERRNILWATMDAMERAYLGLGLPHGSAVVDGNRIPTGLFGIAEAVVAADARIECVAAASILAKTERDDHMRALALEFPEYGFDKHFGYATPQHMKAIEDHGPCRIHRLGFAPFRQDPQLCLALDA